MSIAQRKNFYSDNQTKYYGKRHENKLRKHLWTLKDSASYYHMKKTCSAASLTN